MPPRSRPARSRIPIASTLLVVALLAVAVVVPLAERGAEVATSDAWPADAVIYHVFVDRFADGDAADTQVAGAPEDPGYVDALTDWMGGDLAGLRTRLDHVVATGANTLWLSPVTPGPYFHGYHPTGLTDVDPRFGDVDELRRLVDDAHGRGLKVIYDLVLNHTSDQHPWFVAAQADCTGSEYVAWYRFRACPDSYDAFAGLPELPQLATDHLPLREHLLDEVLPFWLDEVGVDGFRLDHVEGPSRDFWAWLRDELDARWPDTFLLGEVWAQQTTIDSYGAVLDAATAFPFRDRAVAVLARGGNVPAMSMPVAGWLDDAGMVRPTIPLPATYLSSHDQSRFTFEAGGDADRTALAYRTLLTLPGVPVLYYGDEVGGSQTEALPDGAAFQDRWFREPMPWDDDTWDRDVFDAIAELARLRTTTPALYEGSYRELVADGALWVFERAADGERLLVVVNTGDEPATVDLADLLPGEDLPGGTVVDPLTLELVEVP